MSEWPHERRPRGGIAAHRGVERRRQDMVRGTTNSPNRASGWSGVRGTQNRGRFGVVLDCHKPAEASELKNSKEWPLRERKSGRQKVLVGWWGALGTYRVQVRAVGIKTATTIECSTRHSSAIALRRTSSVTVTKLTAVTLA